MATWGADAPGCAGASLPPFAAPDLRRGSHKHKNTSPHTVGYATVEKRPCDVPRSGDVTQKQRSGRRQGS
jgi:hypothetical protein